MNFNPELRFIVTSDIHYKMDSDVEKERFEKGMQLALRYAENSSYKNIDAFFAVGDFANRGAYDEMMKFKASLDKCFTDDTKKVLMLASHEFHGEGGQERAEQQLKEIFNQEPDTYLTIKGRHFICISTEDGCRIKEAKQQWLKDCLEDSIKDGREKPIFVFQHPHLTDTVYGSINWGDDDIIAILTDYPQVIDFSGHSHAPVNDPRSIHQKYFTSLGTGSFSYFELDEFDFMYGTVPPDCDECAQYYIVEADKDNRVRILAVDVLTESFFNDGYLIETPWEPDSFIYTDRRALTESAPYFPADFSCKTEVKDDSLFISFSQAKSDSFGVDSYSVVLRENDSNSILAQKKISSSYYRKNMPQFLELNIDKPKNKGIYKIEITANGFWHAKSDKFTHIFTLE